MSAFETYANNPTADNWSDYEFECESDNDLEPAHICGTCKHFRSADIAEEREEFEDLGVCSALLPCEPSSPFARELVVLYDDTPPDYGTGSCWEGV